MSKQVDKDFMLTTVDNPYNPFTNWEEWYKWDMLSGYDTCGFLARVAPTSDKFSDERNEESIDDAMNQIVQALPGIYRKITKDEVIDQEVAAGIREV